MSIVLYSGDKDGRIYWIDEHHPQTDEKIAVCRVVEGGWLRHSTTKSRNDLTLYLLTEKKADGSINMGCYPERLNAQVESANTKA